MATASFNVLIDRALDLGLDPKDVRVAASRTINRVTRETRTNIARAITAELNVPASYVSPSNERLSITQFSQPNELESMITAKGRATSLARFVSGSKKVGRPGVAVNVKPSSSSMLERAFLIPLRRGLSDVTDGPSNLGLAIRLRKGESLSKTTAAKRIGRNLYLLYGPSVAQVFENNAGTGEVKDQTPDIEARLAQEFFRLIGRKFK